MYYSAHNSYTFDQVAAAIAALESSSTLGKDNLPRFSLSKARKTASVADFELMELLAQSIVATRKLVKDGLIPKQNLLASTSLSPASGPGNENKGFAYWWGYEVFIDSATTNRLVADLTIGSGLAALVAVLGGVTGPPFGVPIAIIFGLAAAILTVGLGVLAAANAAGRGVVFRGIWVPPLFYVSSQ